MAKRRKARAGKKSWRFAPLIRFTGILFTALVVRLLYVSSIRDSPFALVLQTNPLRYHVWAQAILDGTAPSPPFDQPPAYAYFVAALYWIGGAEPHNVRMVQAFLDALQCALLASLAAQGAWPLAAAWATGLLAAIYGPFIFFTGEILPASVSLLFLTSAVVAGACQRWRAAGLFWLLSTLFRAELLLPTIALVAWLYVRNQRGAAIGIAGIVFAGWLLATIGVSVTAGRLVPYTTGIGLNLWLGNNPYADGVDPFPPQPLRAAVDRARAAVQNDAVKLDGWFLGQAIEFWRDFPFQAVRLTWKKFRWTLVDRELPNSGDVPWQQAYSWLFRLGLFPLSFGVVLCLAAGTVGAGLLRQASPPGLVPLIFVALGTLFTCTFFFTNGRFRLPLSLLLLLLAGRFVGALVDHKSRREWRNYLPTVLGSMALASWMAFANPFKVRDYFVPALIANAGIAERLAGSPDRAIRLLERALSAAREDDLAWSHLALAKEQKGDLAGAMSAYLDGLSFAPHSRDLRKLAREFCLRYGVEPDWISEWTQNLSAPERQALRTRLVESFRVP